MYTFSAEMYTCGSRVRVPFYLIINIINKKRVRVRAREKKASPM
jgi:hypothetical protein